jgi:signal peptidase II
VAALIVVDQVVKILVKTHMQIGEDIPLIGEWCRLHFIENEGFAFGMSMGGATGKVVLTLLRLVASAAIAWLLVRLVKGGTRSSLVVSLALIFAGAVGNLVDSCFYGLIFNESYYSVATLFPAEGGYAPLLQGKVVDMFYFPLFEFDWPTWVPLVGGNHFEFFNAIFNVADSAITIGIVWLMIDQFFIAPKYKKSEGNE